ncbi:VUT family protein [Micromonospora sp. WMMD1082]|uniref:VUT family protein n=1 Tax=Micromonospora sp. WMMD1082 TaxID=3016104 RepID=UPI0024177072|nr:VUT family protein [Micromonospora sp. WMMD1082]MDG4795073.1 VUT family protein [Micromonospora sp. WMMD1082]
MARSTRRPTQPTTPADHHPAGTHHRTSPPLPRQAQAHRVRHRRPTRPVRHRHRGAAMVAFAGGVMTANWLTSTYELVPVGFGMTAAAGTAAAGYTLLARDWVHEVVGRRAVLACIAAGAVLSAVLAAPALALASAAAFAVSELADLLVYQPLRRRGFLLAVLASNAVGAPLDTVVFLTLAGFPVWSALPGQMWVKAWVTLIPVAAVLAAHALLRHRLRPDRP